MQDIITLEVLSALSENNFSLDELVFRTKELFEREGLSGFVSLILQLADERICINMVQGKMSTPAVHSRSMSIMINWIVSFELPWVRS